MDEKNLKEWLIDFRNRMKDIPVSMKEITGVVEEVREDRYSIEKEIDSVWNNIGKKLKESGIK